MKCWKCEAEHYVDNVAPVCIQCYDILRKRVEELGRAADRGKQAGAIGDVMKCGHNRHWLSYFGEDCMICLREKEKSRAESLQRRVDELEAVKRSCRDKDHGAYAVDCNCHECTALKRAETAEQERDELKVRLESLAEWTKRQEENEAKLGLAEKRLAAYEASEDDQDLEWALARVKELENKAGWSDNKRMGIRLAVAVGSLRADRDVWKEEVVLMHKHATDVCPSCGFDNIQSPAALVLNGKLNEAVKALERLSKSKPNLAEPSYVIMDAVNELASDALARIQGGR